MVCVLLSHTHQVTCHVISCDMTLSHTPSYIVSPKEKEKKRNINNNLAILPSHDSTYHKRPLTICDWVEG